MSVWNNIWPILVAVIVFLFMILIHELGHFLMAKLNGVRVNEFAIGFGPTLLRWRGKETKYSLRLVPFGGFCAMEGEDSESSDERAFCNKKPWRRFLIVIGGALFNIIFGFILIMIVLLPEKYYASTTVARFEEVSESSNHGLQVGDKIVNVDGRNIYTFMDLSYAFTNVPDGMVDLTVIRNGEKQKLDNVKFSTSQEQSISYINIDFKVEAIKRTPLTFISQSLKSTVSYVRIVWFSLIDLITGKFGISAVSGPVGVTAAIGEAAKTNLPTLLNLIALITINLGVFNLLPVPALDGGRLIFILIEMIFRKPVPQKYESMVHAVGLILLLGLILVVTLKDILGLFA